ncbi:hypothetical protein FRACYDRAFT_250323 [Fragilariopsis cylindrus CCMP1102]|uniref:Uncharacterized protein n=1 Tax=Fragilariopsis cylindrus CCMP1102 TaxID=635003 RepID=A0A1E7EQ82_9STRA|nr:hypothetical protein FRACYDRAFT_250323 [Fragilariopsis cylindrus CCMP1102]|eukprot:OEU08101.1 hypothetical protein FRACYDRAFT_250323 [Fragilariopsis cylindrus CCMP1102]
MAPTLLWSQIAKPFSIHFAFNCLKTIIGAALIGYGIAFTKTISSNDDTEEDKSSKENKGTDDNNSNNNINIIKKKYIQISITIGFGLFLALPSLISQIVWETMIPTITATDIAYDNVINITKLSKLFPKLNLKQNLGQLSSQIQFPKIINLGGSGSEGSGGSGGSSSVTGGNHRGGGGSGKVE